MNNKKCVIYSDKSIVNTDNVDNDVFYLDDYLLPPSNRMARVMTENIFENEKKWTKGNWHKGFNLSWIVYDKVFSDALVVTSLKNIIDEVSNYQTIDVTTLDHKYGVIIERYLFDKKVILRKKRLNLNGFKGFLGNILLLMFSFFSLLYFKIKNGSYVGIWTGDFVYKDSKSDFRLINLYDEINKNKINYIEFIRTGTIRGFIVNTFKRKRFAIYYFPVYSFLKIFYLKKSCSPVSPSESMLMHYDRDIYASKKIIDVLVLIIRFLDIKSIISIAFISRTAHFHLAGKIARKKTIGIVHGLTSRDYSVNEFIEVFRDNKKIGPDVFGVWSNYYKDYYIKYCKIVPSNKIFVSGPLRKYRKIRNSKSIDFKPHTQGKVKILLISEPLVNPVSMLGYIKQIVNHDAFDVSIKVRPMIKDSYYEKLINIYSGAEKIKAVDNDIFEAAGGYDILIGSHSTAVLEASLVGRLSLMCYTDQWGDHFNLKPISDKAEMICLNENNIVNVIMDRIQNEGVYQTIDIVRNRYFGKNEDGARWVVDQIEI